jgi:outer membrane receptor protein involved in Fe transport
LVIIPRVRGFLSAGIIAIAFGVIAYPACAQMGISPGLRADNPSILTQKVTIKIHKLKLARALDEVRKQTGVFIGYNEEILSADTTQVTLNVENVSLGSALDSIFARTLFEVHLAAKDQLIVRRRGEHSTTPKELGHGVVGIVTDARTNLPLKDVSVSVDNGKINARTDTAGRYRIPTLYPGPHTISVRRLGYISAHVSFLVLEHGTDLVLEHDLEPTAGQLQRILVTGGISPTEVAPGQPLPFSVTAVGASDLERLHLTRLDQVFRYLVPGAFSWDHGIDALGNSISVRGSGSSGMTTPVRIYIDNVQVADDSYAAIDLGSVERIELIRGPAAAVLYGSGAAGGALRIFTKRGTHKSARPTLHARSELGTGGAGLDGGLALQQRYSLSADGALGKVSYLAGTSYLRAGATPSNAETSVPSGYFGARYIGSKLSLDLSGHYRSQFTGERPDYILPSSIIDTLPWARPTSRSSNMSYTAYAVYDMGLQRHELTMGYDGSNYRSHSLGPVSTQRAPLEMYQPRDRWFGSYRGTAIRGDARGTSVGIAYGAEHSVLHARSWYDLESDLPGAHALFARTFRNIPSDFRATSTVSGAFAHSVFSLDDRIYLTFGGRLERSTAFGKDFGTHLLPTADITIGPLGTKTPIRLWASYGTAASLAPISGGWLMEENRNLRVEHRAGIEGGAEMAFGQRGKIELTLFDQRSVHAWEYVILDITARPLISQPQNVGNVTRQGVEVSAGVDLSRVQLRGHYNFVRSIILSIDSGYTGGLLPGDPMRSVPAHTAGGMATVQLGDRMSATMGLSYIGGWVNDDWASEERAMYGLEPYRGSPRAYLMRYPSVARGRFIVERAISSSLVAFAMVDNIPIKQGYELHNMWPMPAKTVAAGIRIGH